MPVILFYVVVNNVSDTQKRYKADTICYGFGSSKEQVAVSRKELDFGHICDQMHEFIHR